MGRNLAILVVALALGTPFSATSSFAEPPAEESATQLRREVAELKTLVAQLTQRLEAMDERLARLEADRNPRAQSQRLMFPESVERAMMGEDLASPGQRWQQQLDPNGLGQRVDPYRTVPDSLPAKRRHPVIYNYNCR